MNSSHNLHNVHRVTITPVEREDYTWTNLTIEGADGSTCLISLHPAGVGPVDIIVPDNAELVGAS